MQMVVRLIREGATGADRPTSPPRSRRAEPLATAWDDLLEEQQNRFAAEIRDAARGGTWNPAPPSVPGEASAFAALGSESGWSELGEHTLATLSRRLDATGCPAQELICLLRHYGIPPTRLVPVGGSEAIMPLEWNAAFVVYREGSGLTRAALLLCGEGEMEKACLMAGDAARFLECSLCLSPTMISAHVCLAWLGMICGGPESATEHAAKSIEWIQELLADVPQDLSRVEQESVNSADEVLDYLEAIRRDPEGTLLGEDPSH